MKIIIMEGSGRIVNGGSWRSYVDYSRMAYHRRDTPVNRPDRSGFRIVRRSNDENNKGS